MKILLENRKTIVSIFVVMMFIYGGQGIGYAQELVIEPSSETKWLYWAEKSDDSYTIRRIDLANGQSQDVIPGFGPAPPSDIAVDASGGKIYWSEMSHWWARREDRIQRANLDGTDIETIVSDLEGPTGIDLDLGVGRNQIYWADESSLFSNSRIQRADLEGTNVYTVVVDGSGDCMDVAVDVSGGKIYWTYRFINGKIRRANLDGSNVQTIFTGVERINEIAVDASGGKIYWTDNEDDKIQRANLDGTDIEDVATGFSWWEVIDFAIDPSEGKIYWGSSSRDKIQRADLDGANVQDVVTGLGSDVTAIALATIPNKTTSPSSFVEFSDINLARAVRNVLGLSLSSKADLLKIPKAELEKLTKLDASNSRITDLTGLEHATQLTELDLRENQISDITPLAQLTKLTDLYLYDNEISDITPLAQLTKLTELSLTDNQISDITPLAQLTQSKTLYLGYNQIRDVIPLAQLTQLKKLYLHNNEISEIAPLAQLTQLTTLTLTENQIKDVTPLAGLISLERLTLKGNPIWSTYPLNALIDANPDLDVDVRITDAVPFPMPEETSNGGTGLQVLIPEFQQHLMFWINTNTDKIESAGPFDAVTQGVESLTVDRASSKLYWGERSSSGGIIKRANFDGTNIETLVTLSSVPWSIAIDSVGNRLYWANSDLQIQTAILNGEDIRTVIQLEEGIVMAIAVNKADSRLYWTELSGRIRRVNLDGTNLETLVSDLGNPFGITVADGKVYWAEQIGEDSGKIQRANPNGTDIETLVKVQGIPIDISVDTEAGKIYWANSLGGIQRIDLNGGEVEAVVSGITAPGDFVLVPGVQPTTPTTVPTDAAVSISPTSVASPAIGEQLAFNLNITSGEAVAGYQATVQFDTTALRYVSSANGDYLPDTAFFVQTAAEGNLVTLNAASLAGESNGDGTLATLTFEVLAVKASTLTLSDVLLTNKAGETFSPQVENAEITESTVLKGDVNGDGTVNIADLVLVASNLGKTGQNAADVNGDGQVNIADLVLVAGALGNTAAAPSLYSHALEMLTAVEVKQWLSAAQQLDFTDTTSQRGIQFLQQLLAALTPKETALLANYPNPFNPETWIPYHLSKDADVTLHIYAVNGTLVRTLTLGHQAAGMYQSRSRAAYWDGKNELGEKVASGVYFYTLTAGDFTATRKMLIRK